MAEFLPSAARVVVIGGGVMGCSIAYHLAKAGCSDVVVLERKQLTSGTTWHSAAQVRQLRSTANITRMARHSVELYASLEEETGQATGWIQKGSLSIAATPDRLVHVKRQAALARLFGVAAEVVDVAEAGRLWPLMRSDDLLGAVYSPDDGRVNPSDLTAALVRGAKAGGARVFEDTAVTGFEKKNGRIAAVVTERGRIACEAVALAAGLWSRQVAALAGVIAPLYACEHFFLVTEPVDGIDGHLPTLSDHDGYLYIRDEVGGLLVGCFEPGAKPLPMEKLPKDFAFDLLNEDWDHFEPMLVNAMHRIPALETAEARMLLNGPESFTPDGHFMLGESPELAGFFLGCGMNSVGVATAGGAGRALAEWIVEGVPGMDLWEVDPRRFLPFHNNLKLLHERVPEVLSVHYQISYPGREPQTARGVRLTPLHARHAEAGAHFGQTVGWERPLYYVPEGEEVGDELTFGRPEWFDCVAAECAVARDGVARLDQSTFAKFLIEGVDAEAVLQRLCAGDLAVASGRMVYTQMLNEQGGIENDLVALRLDETAYLLLTGTAKPRRDLDWIRRNTPSDARIAVTDVTSAYAQLAISGPNTRTLMERLAGGDFSNEAFSFYTFQTIDAGPARILAGRISFLGELGWELYIPNESAVAVFDAVSEAGTGLDLRDIGAYAMTSLRIEKAFRSWGHDLTPEDTPLEAGLGFAVKPDKGCDFIGRDAFLKQREAGPKRRLVVLTCADDSAHPIGGEPILHDGEPVGQVTSAAFGHRLGGAVALGYVERDADTIEAMAAAGGFALDIACEAAPVTISFDAPYDPAGTRMRC